MLDLSVGKLVKRKASATGAGVNIVARTAIPTRVDETGETGRATWALALVLGLTFGFAFGSALSSPFFGLGVDGLSALAGAALGASK